MPAASPSSTGARYSSSSSTQPADTRAPLSPAPASTWTSLNCSWAIQRIIAGRSTRPGSAPGRHTTRAFRAARRSAFAASSRAVNRMTSPPSNRRASSGIWNRPSTTALRGWRGVSTPRTLSWGSSFRTVPMPVRTTQLRARQRCPSARASGPVIHCDMPLCRALRPSSDAAIFIHTQGSPRLMREMKPAFTASASSRQTPVATSMPASRRRASPCPLTSGFGSPIATTTRAGFAASTASTQGGVRPKWLQGSRVTYSVAQATDSPRDWASRSAQTSACGPPGGCVAPSPSTRPSRTITQPTRGLGAVVYMTVCASARARRIQKRSSESLGMFMPRIVCLAGATLAALSGPSTTPSPDVRFRPSSVLEGARKDAGSG
ncbi:hypothetical protein D3C72_1061070 [compost metagenome]